MVRWRPEAAPLLFPFLFITIACGAISGFHCLVSSGTSSKQIRCETDAKFVGYGSMLTEGFLATLVILACVAGLGLGITGGNGELLLGAAAYESRYESWTAASGLSAKIAAFVDGAGNVLQAMGVPSAVAVALVGVLVASFAGTTLDTACRLQRYVVQELATVIKPVSVLRNPYAATTFAVVTATIMAAMPPPGSVWSLENAGRGGLILWPMFGATNQLLGGLAFMVIAFWLWRRKLPVWFAVPPMLFMLVMPAWAMIWLLFVGDAAWIRAETPNWVLIVVAIATLALEVWMIVEAVLMWPRVRGELELAPA
jgi:carbon starvation protein